jgi:hypothetical protein
LVLAAIGIGGDLGIPGGDRRAALAHVEDLRYASALDASRGVEGLAL